MRDGRLNVVGIGGTLRENSTSLGALMRVLQAAEEAGADTELLDLRDLDLPMYVPGKKLDEYGENVERFLEDIREADALVISTAAYHGTLAGVTKNALDFAQFLARDERPYLDGKVVGLVSTAGGEQAAANATGALVNVVHALRGIVAPLMVPIPKAWRLSDDQGNITDENYGGRLDKLGELLVDLALRLRTGESAEQEALRVGRS
ncbi:MAG: NAD(P)H-dependent oxidoreductase [Actinomycetota bacterium]|nr:NAD(P)H-dependent oxidoreductase [Actinomycetota bacterium]HZY66260.1 NADPH-dependent FMN reductase [Rubrobacteraceae bacterium]